MFNLDSRYYTMIIEATGSEAWFFKKSSTLSGSSPYDWLKSKKDVSAVLKLIRKEFGV